jgi:hypothetical protein
MEEGMATSMASVGRNFTVSMKKVIRRNAKSTIGVISMAVLFRATFAFAIG